MGANKGKGPKARQIRSLSNDKIEEFQSEDQSMPHMTDEHNVSIGNIYSNDKMNSPRVRFENDMNTLNNSPRVRFE